MALSARHLVAAGTMAGAVVLGGAGWAAAQDSPSTTDNDSTTTTTERDKGSDDGTQSPDHEGRAHEDGPRSGENCSHGEDKSGASSDSSSDDDSSTDSSTDGSAQASAFWS